MLQPSSLILAASLPRPIKRQRTSQQQEDLLPPFSTLTNNEDREKKAEYRNPGSYNLVVNPSSFAELDEYKNNYHNQTSPKSTPSKGPESDQSNNEESQDSAPKGGDFNESQTSDDPDIVILKVFEDDIPKSGSPTTLVVRDQSWKRPNVSLPSSAGSAHYADYFRFSYENTPLMRMAHNDGRDHQLVYYYKNFVHRHLGQVHRDSLGTSLEIGALSAPDVFERQAASFLPVRRYSIASLSAWLGIAVLKETLVLDFVAQLG